MSATVGPLELTVRAVYGRVLPEQEPQKLPSMLTAKEVFVRRRLNTKSAQPDAPFGAEGPDYALFKPVQGLVNHDMYHTDYGDKKFHYEDRAVLIQSLESYKETMESQEMGEYLTMYHGKTEEESVELVLNDPGFGEQIIVEGCTADNLCIGDIFQLEGSRLKMEVTSPRYPCSMVDRKFQTRFGTKGMRRYALNNASAGWFCRVLKTGHVSCSNQCCELYRFLTVCISGC